MYHQVYDRGISDQMALYVSGVWHSLGDESLEVDAWSMSHAENYNLHTMVHCACHDIHNSLKWSHFSLFNDKQLLKSVYIAVSALRMSSLHAASHVLDWFQTALFPRDLAHLVPAADLTGVWTVLGVDADVLEVLVKYRAWFRGSRLEVHDEAVNMEGALEELSVAILSVWKYTAFAESRWATLGHCPRVVMGGVVLGFESMFAWLCDRGVLTEYEQHGVERLDAKGREFLCVLALSSSISDSMLLAVLADNRVAQQAEVLEHGVAEEVLYTDALPLSIWELLSSQLGSTGAPRLRDLCIRSAFISAAFLKYRIFDTANNYPWCLCKGDLEQNLRDLASASDVEEPVARSFQTLVQSGESFAKVHQALQLLSQCSWSAAHTEKQHGSHAAVRKAHAELSLETLLHRGFLHGAAQLLPERDHNQTSKTERCRKHLRKLLSARPQNIKGRQVFLQHVMSKLKDVNTEREDEQQLSRRFAMAKHGKHWSALSDEAKAGWEREALLARSSKEQSLSAQLEDAEARLDVAIAQNESSQHTDKTGPSMLMRTCRWNSGDLERLAETMNDRKGLQASALNHVVVDEGPPPLSAELFQQAKHKTKLHLSPMRVEVTTMYKDVAKLRQHFENALFRVKIAGAPLYYRFIFATLSPIRVFCLQVESDEIVMPDMHPSKYSEYITHTPVHQWTFPSLKITCENFFASVPEVSEIDVCMLTFYSGSCKVASFGDYKPLEPIVAGLLHELSKHREVREPDGENKDKAASEESDSDSAGEQGSAASGSDGEAAQSTGSASHDIPRVGHDVVDHDEAEYTKVFAEVEAERRTWADLGNEESSMFSTQVTGGMWQVDRSKTALYGLRTFLKKNTSGYVMATSFGLNLSAAFGFEKFGKSGAGALCRLWQQRYILLTETWTAAGCPSTCFPEIPIEAVQDEALDRELEKGNTEVRKRRDEILALRPS